MKTTTAAGLSRKQMRALVWSIALAIGGYLAVSMWSGWREVIGAASRIGLTGITIALILSLINYGLRFVRWHYYLGLLGHPVPVASNLRIYLTGFALTTTPGKAGEMIRSVFLAPLGVSYSKSLAAFFSERLSDLIAVLAIAMIGIASYPQGRPVFYFLVASAMAVLFTIHRHSWLNRIKHYIDDKFSGRARNAVVGLVDIALHSRQLYRWTPLFSGLLLGFIAWWAEAYAFHLMIGWMGLQIPLSVAVFIYAFSMIIGAVSFLPGGLGGVEVAMVALLVLNRVPAAEAVALTILIRITTLWFAVVIGLGVLLRYRRHP
ncbi:MAG: lysylphosphatidylglycerol synthase transmembrane domain-containing protein [Acidiferrobacterales bacterium]